MDKNGTSVVLISHAKLVEEVAVAIIYMRRRTYSGFTRDLYTARFDHGATAVFLHGQKPKVPCCVRTPLLNSSKDGTIWNSHCYAWMKTKPEFGSLESFSRLERPVISTRENDKWEQKNEFWLILEDRSLEAEAQQRGVCKSTESNLMQPENKQKLQKLPWRRVHQPLRPFFEGFRIPAGLAEPCAKKKLNWIQSSKKPPAPIIG